MVRSISAQILALGIVGVLFFGCKARHQDRPTSKPDNAVAAFAPKGTMTVIHLNGKALAFIDLVLGELRKTEEFKSGPLPATIKGLAEKIESIDIYFDSKAEREGRNVSLIALFRPMVIRASCDVPQLFEAFHHIFPDLPLELTKGDNGRYLLAPKGEKQGLTVIDGAAASDVKEPIILLAADPNVVVDLKAGLSGELTVLLAKVDPQADAWLVGRLSTPPPSQSNQSPIAVWGSLYADGRKESTFTQKYDTDAAALRGAKLFVVDGDGMYKGVLKVKTEGAEITGTATFSKDFQAKVAAAVVMNKKEGVRASSIGHLYSIGVWIGRYKNSMKGKMPADLTELVKLVKEGLITPNALVQPRDPPSVLNTADKWVPTAPRDYVYIKPSAKGVNDPSKLVVVYEPAERNDGDGGYVLYLDGRVKWLKAAELKVEIEKARKLAQTE